MADGTEAPPTPDLPAGVVEDRQDEETIDLSEEGRALIEETADLVVDLPD